MKIKSAKIRNFRCFPERESGRWGAEFRPNSHSNLIIGPNGAGKTALLDALDLVLNAENRSNQALITEFDFSNCDTDKTLYIEVTLTDLGQARGEFVSDVQWVDPSDGQLVEEKGVEPNLGDHEEAVVLALEALLDQYSGAIEWHWLLPKFPATSIEKAKELSRSQHQSLGYFRIRPAISAGAFTLGQYSALGRHLKKLQYRLGKLPPGLRGQTSPPSCSLENPQCSSCPSKPDCVPDMEDDVAIPGNESPSTVGKVLNAIVSGARKVLSSSEWAEMQPTLGPRYGGMSSALAALTIGLRPTAETNQAFIPFDRLSSGEKYALSFSLAKAQIPGERPPVIVMEEPETALYPSAVTTLIRDIQAIPTGETPQVIISSHSECVLRCFSSDDIFVVGKGQNPKKLSKIIEGVRPTAGPFHKPEYLIMPGGPSVLFADKVLVVEGAQEAVVSGQLDRLSAKLSAIGKNTHISFATKGWCVFPADKADQIKDCVNVFKALGKKTAALFDRDGNWSTYTGGTKGICPTFVYISNQCSSPTLEDALIEGLPEPDRKAALEQLQSHEECKSCQRGPKCWIPGGKCQNGDKQNRKAYLQNICLDLYDQRHLFPPAFESLLGQIDSASIDQIHELKVDR